MRRTAIAVQLHRFSASSRCSFTQSSSSKPTLPLWRDAYADTIHERSLMPAIARSLTTSTATATPRSASSESTARTTGRPHMYGHERCHSTSSVHRPSMVSSSATVGDKDSGVTVSARQRFKDVPIHSSILDYIRSIGIGIPPRASLKRNRKNHQQLPFMNDQRRPRGRRRSTAHGDRLVNAAANAEMNASRASSYSAQSKGVDSSSHYHYSCWPPPPFGPNSLPVQVIASVGPESVQHIKHHAHADADTDHSGTLVVDRKDFPKNEAGIAEIALAGRSNVGKSTLLNALLYGNRDVAITGTTTTASKTTTSRRRGRVPPNVKLLKGVKATMSSKPGETRRITFYKLQHVSPATASAAAAASANSATAKPVSSKSSSSVTEHRRLLLVDLPGYGFAYAKESHAAAYRALMTDYILHRGKTLKRVLVLLDARHGMKPADVDFLNQLQSSSGAQSVRLPPPSSSSILPPIQLVLTKCDLVPQADLARRVAQVRQQLSDVLRREPSQLPIMLVSARPGVGYNNIDRHTNRAHGGVLELQKELAALAKVKRSERT